MAYENFLTYTEVDPASRISKTTTRVSWTALQRAEVAYVYKDYGVGYFSGDFIHLITVDMTAVATSSQASYWGMSNTLGNYKAVIDDSGYGIFVGLGEVSGPSTRLWLFEIYGGSSANSSYVYTTGTILYLKIVRDESVGTYGTAYCYIYSDAARSILLQTLSLTLHTQKTDYRYLYACQAYGYAGTQAQTGYSENLELVALSAPTATTQAVTSIVTTTATGNGNITSLGVPNPTAHGVCWNTTGTPTTADSKTDEGAATATGAFTSAMTGLTAGTKYYVRSYATNSVDTSYGNEVEFTADQGTVVPDTATDPLRRVSGIFRTFSAGIGGQSVYQVILTLGGISSTYVSPIGSREPQSAVAPAPTPSGAGYQESDYFAWLVRNSLDNIVRIFGGRPTYSEWVKWMQGRYRELR